MEPVHIVAEKDSIAPIVLLPGDPLRAKYIAENFLEDAVLVNSVRNMLGYTGYYKGVRVTVMGSGMGIASVGIYAYELYHFYNVEKIIRIGSSGSLNPNAKILDVILSTGAYSESTFENTLLKCENSFIESSKELNKIILNTAKEMNITNLKYGPTYTSDVFDVYCDISDLINRCPIKDDLMCVEMEGFGLMHIAAYCNKQASMLATIVDSKYQPDVIVSPEDRETSLNTMITLALESIIK
ncbi:MAG: purine-nucleoside phosphorylase [Bacilli bacterium]|nr:purine-nucleoside phosphorylase [Bacilli bacterium]